MLIPLLMNLGFAGGSTVVTPTATYYLLSKVSEDPDVYMARRVL